MAQPEAPQEGPSITVEMADRVDAYKAAVSLIAQSIAMHGASATDVLELAQWLAGEL